RRRRRGRGPAGGRGGTRGRCGRSWVCLLLRHGGAKGGRRWGRHPTLRSAGSVGCTAGRRTGVGRRAAVVLSRYSACKRAADFSAAGAGAAPAAGATCPAACSPARDAALATRRHLHLSATRRARLTFRPRVLKWVVRAQDGGTV